MSVQNLNTFGSYSYSLPPLPLSSTSDSSLDPFADAADPLAAEEPGRQSYIHIRIQQRNGRKTLTTLQGLPKGESYPVPVHMVILTLSCRIRCKEDSEGFQEGVCDLL